MEPAILESLCCCRWVIQVSLHDQIAPHENFTHRLAILGDWDERLWICNHEALQCHVPHTLASFESGLLINRQLTPLLIPFANHSWSKDFRQAIHVRDVYAQLLHLSKNWRWRSRCSNHHLQLMIPSFRLWVSDHSAHNYRSSAEMCHALPCNEHEHHLGVNLPQANMYTCKSGNRPWEAPARTMEHGQCPKVDRVSFNAPSECVVDCIEVGAPVMRDHSLWVCSCATSVTKCQGVPFISNIFYFKSNIACRNQFLIGRGSKMRTSRISLLIINIDNNRALIGLQKLQGCRDHRAEFSVSNQQFRTTVAKAKSNVFGVKARVQWIDDATHHGDAVEALKKLRCVCKHDSYGIAMTKTSAHQRRCQQL
mmetsp:Transcript_144902/g.255424  ORF Transcript_144902/g.255424 Transcript_144902/m.255424 type:complete len:367 (+) Transcript_144902:539-1639(+)